MYKSVYMDMEELMEKKKKRNKKIERKIRKINISIFSKKKYFHNILKQN